MTEQSALALWHKYAGGGRGAAAPPPAQQATEGHKTASPKYFMTNDHIDSECEGKVAE